MTALDFTSSAETLAVCCGWKGGEVQRVTFGDRHTRLLVRRDRAHGVSPRTEQECRESAPYLTARNECDVVAVAFIDIDGEPSAVSAGIDGRVVAGDGSEVFNTDPLRMLGGDYSTYSRSMTAMCGAGSMISFAVDDEVASVHLMDLPTRDVVASFPAPAGPADALDICDVDGSRKVALISGALVSLWDEAGDAILWSTSLG